MESRLGRILDIGFKIYDRRERIKGELLELASDVLEQNKYDIKLKAVSADVRRALLTRLGREPYPTTEELDKVVYDVLKST